MSISITQTLKKSSKFSGVTLLGKIINFPKAIIVAMVLGPAEFGLVGSVLLITSYANLIHFGTLGVVFREMPGLIKLDQEKKAFQIQNIGITFDLLINIFLFISILGYAFYKIPSIYGILLLFVAFNFIIKKIYSYYETVNLARENFDLVAKSRFYNTVLVPILTIICIFWLKIYTLVIIPILGTGIALIYLRKKFPIGFRSNFNKAELKRMLKIGISISAGGFLYNIFVGTIDQTVILYYLTKEELGLFIYALGYANLLIEFLRDIGRVLSPSIWANADKANSDFEAFYDIKRFAIFTAISASLLITFSQLGYVFLVNVFTVKFVDTQILFFILTFQIFLESIGYYPEMILGSNRANGQNKILIANGVGVFLNIVLDIVVIKMGFGLVGIVLITVLCKGLTSILMFLFTKKYLINKMSDFLLFLKELFFPFLIALIITIINLKLIYMLSFWIMIGVSFVLQVIIWMSFLHFVKIEYFDKTKLVFAIRNFKNAITSKLKFNLNY